MPKCNNNKESNLSVNATYSSQENQDMLHKHNQTQHHQIRFSSSKCTKLHLGQGCMTLGNSTPQSPCWINGVKPRPLLKSLTMGKATLLESVLLEKHQKKQMSSIPIRRSNSCLTSTASLVSLSGTTRLLTARVTALNTNNTHYTKYY